MIAVDLGCGAKKRLPVGVDLAPLPGVDHVVHLGFEALPFADGSVSRFEAHDLVEHVPRAVYLERGGKIETFRPVIFFFNEVFRCLERGGTFRHVTPAYPAMEVWQDPTHVHVWTDHSHLYYTGFFPKELTDTYGIACRFALASKARTTAGTHLDETWRKP